MYTGAKVIQRGRNTLSTNSSGATRYPNSKEKKFLISRYIKKKLKMDQRPIYKNQNYKTLRRKHIVSLQDFGFGNSFLHMISKTHAKKIKN